MRMLLVVAVLFGAQDSRAPVPEKEAQKAARKELHKYYANDYAKVEPADRVFLAKKLLEKARGMAAADVAKFMHFSEARDLAIMGADPTVVAEVVDEIAETFQVDRAAMKSQALQVAERGMKTPEPALLSKLYLKTSAEAIAGERLDIATLTAAQAHQHARKAKDAWLQERASIREKEVAEHKSTLEKVKKARTTLGTAPDDAEANLLVGRWLALYRGDWAGAVPHLLKGSDAALKGIAEAEQADSNSAAKKAELGEMLWDKSSSEKGVARAGLRDRSLHWYEEALSGLSTEGRDKAERRIVSWRSERGGGWEDVSDPKLWGETRLPMRVSPQGNVLANLKLQKMPLGTFDAIQVRFSMGKAKDAMFAILAEKGNWCATAQRGSDLRAQRKTPENSWEDHEKSGGIDDRPEWVLEVAVVPGSFVVSLDGKERLRSPTGDSAITEAAVQGTFDWYAVHEVRLRYRR